MFFQPLTEPANNPRAKYCCSEKKTTGGKSIEMQSTCSVSPFLPRVFNRDQRQTNINLKAHDSAKKFLGRRLTHNNAFMIEWRAPMLTSLKLRLPAVLDRLQPSEAAILIGTAIAVGAGTGLGAVLFINLIALTQTILFQGLPAVLPFVGRGLFILAPAIGGLLAGPIIAFFAKEAKGHGVPEVMQAIALKGGRIRPRVVVAKVAASALCIGSGGSAGREGPIVQVGAALGSTLGQWLHLSESRIRNLVACGSAAGIAATFNAPIAGVMFAMEIILGELHLGDLGNVVVAAVTASTIARVFLGDRPAFSIPSSGVKTFWEVLLYAPLGILAAVVAVGFIRLLYGFEDRFDRLRLPEALKPAAGGVILGMLAFFYPMLLGLGFVPSEESLMGLPLANSVPHVFGSGFPVIEDALLGQLSFALLFVLILLKPLATSLTLGSGNSGGVFAPTLFTGAALGGAFGKVVEYFLPAQTAGPGAFATVGMAAVFAGAARAPITAILIVFEMTNDYRLILPVMAGVIVSFILAEKLYPESIYTLKLTRRGIRLRRGRDVDVMESVGVDEVMVRQPVTEPVDLPVSLLAGEILRTGRHGFPVLNEDGSLFGMVSLEDYHRATGGDGGKQMQDPLTLRDIATRDVVSVFPDDSVGTALRRMAPRDLSRLPVVARDNPRHLVGVVRRNDIVHAYEVGALRRDEARQRSEMQLASPDPRAEFVEMRVGADSATVGKKVSELQIPRAAVLVSITRGSDLVIPHGDTRLAAGDVVIALCQREHIDQVRAAISHPRPPAPAVEAKAGPRAGPVD
jgi:chloride channel protein, CIC family